MSPRSAGLSTSITSAIAVSRSVAASASRQPSTFEKSSDLIRTRPANRSAKPRQEREIGGVIGAGVEADHVEALAALLVDTVERGRHLVGRAQPEHRIAHGDAVAKGSAQESR